MGLELSGVSTTLFTPQRAARAALVPVREPSQFIPFGSLNARSRSTVIITRHLLYESGQDDVISDVDSLDITPDTG